MATTVERRRSTLTNEPTFEGRSGYEDSDARISITARGPHCASPPQAGSLRADVQASQNHLAEPGRTIHSFGFARSTERPPIPLRLPAAARRRDQRQVLEQGRGGTRPGAFDRQQAKFGGDAAVRREAPNLAAG